jgi:RHS repeat-associated protein
VWQWAYSAFGDNKPSGLLKATTNPKAAMTNQPILLKATAPALKVNLRFAGQYADEESNLFENGYRSYRPGLGSYAQGDPIGLNGGWNRFGYVGGNPLSRTDPVGLCPWCVIPALPYVGEAAVIGAAWWASQNTYIKPPANAYDPNGPKAPGKPGDVEGFCEPKGGDDWVRNPNGRGNGWRARDGGVWVPTGPDSGSTGDAHGGPHWDVQYPGGGYDNVYPGGLRR